MEVDLSIRNNERDMELVERMAEVRIVFDESEMTDSRATYLLLRKASRNKPGLGHRQNKHEID